MRKLALAALLIIACDRPDSDARTGVLAPSLASFPPLGDVLALRCGSLDCHGARTRNFIVWSCEGLRADPTMTSATCARSAATTGDEYAKTFDSLVGLEPEVMTEVVRGGDPSLLTLVRKARGTESHKGGAPIHTGDASDRCITLWLAGTDDATYQATCTTALQNGALPGP
jgi:hypothetical protein